MSNTKAPRSLLAVHASTAVLCALAAPAAAQSLGGASATPANRASTPAAAADAAYAIDEIVVTAQKRSQSINTVGMSITAATGETLQAKGVHEVADLTKIDPSFQYSQSSNSTPVFTIRGVGYFEQSLAATPTVSIYQDEVPYPVGAMSRGALLDVERVEVLKGPQGTLFGQNATGGAVNFIAAQPTSETTSGLSASLERFGRVQAEGFVSGALSSTVRARLSASLDQGGAWQKSRTRDDTLGDRDTLVGRLLLEWTPSERLEATLNLNSWRDKSEPQAWQAAGVWFATPANISPNNLTPLQANFVPNAAFFATYPDSIKALLAQPLAPSDNRQADWAPGPHPRNDATFYQGSLRLRYHLTDSISVTSLTSYQSYHQLNRPDLGGVGFIYALGSLRGNVTSVFQELRFNGSLAGEKGNWLVGVNYANDRNKEEDAFGPLAASPEFLTGGSPFSAIPLRPFVFGARNNVSTKTRAVFAHVEYPLLDGLTLNTGIRYTSSRQKIAACSFTDEPLDLIINGIAGQLAAAFRSPAPTPAGPADCATLAPPPTFQPGLNRTKLNEDNVAWRAGLDWVPAPRSLVYAVASKGYKAGTSPALGATTAIQLEPVDQESVLSYEAGAKLALLHGTVQLNAAAFHYDYNNKQVLGRVNDALGIFGAVQALVNIPKSRVNGAEASVDWRPMRGLQVNGAATYLDSKVTRDFINYSTYIISDADKINFKGESFPYTPKWALQYGVRYGWALSGELNAFVSADGSYQSRTNGFFGASRTDAIGAPSVTIKPYALLNLAGGVEAADQRWRVEVFGRNVTNTYYWHTAFWANDVTSRVAGIPATFGVRVQYRP